MNLINTSKAYLKDFMALSSMLVFFIMLIKWSEILLSF
jgi:hypothetical protein